MTYWEISYYRTHNWIDKRYVSAELGVTQAIRKARVKNPIDAVEITQEEYIKYSKIKKEQAKAKKERNENRYILT